MGEGHKRHSRLGYKVISHISCDMCPAMRPCLLECLLSSRTTISREVSFQISGRQSRCILWDQYWWRCHGNKINRGLTFTEVQWRTQSLCPRGHSVARGIGLHRHERVLSGGVSADVFLVVSRLSNPSRCSRYYVAFLVRQVCWVRSVSACWGHCVRSLTLDYSPTIKDGQPLNTTLDMVLSFPCISGNVNSAAHI